MPYRVLNGHLMAETVRRARVRLVFLVRLQGRHPNAPWASSARAIPAEQSRLASDISSKRSRRYASLLTSRVARYQ
jgi:hypothetical protein